MIITTIGVVYCEMLGRENTESDLLSFNLNQALYPNTGYQYETGGLTKDIATLNNNEVRKYHRKFYNPEHFKILVVGQVDEKQLFEALKKVDFSG